LDQGKANTICTVYEIQEGEDAEDQGLLFVVMKSERDDIDSFWFFFFFVSADLTEFYKIDTDTLMKALQALEKEGKAQIFQGSSADNLGVKFFGP
jgi:hypothetical protein